MNQNYGRDQQGENNLVVEVMFRFTWSRDNAGRGVKRNPSRTHGFCCGVNIKERVVGVESGRARPGNLVSEFRKTFNIGKEWGWQLYL
jgi:hypothetical protein